ncbi:MAG TPA: nicotinate phosphoribosyltransferase, partial [Thermoprotei archaeon]|nr:nicotinate phosphoribosyltransferase [Thermoprotei archaeon]
MSRPLYIATLDEIIDGKVTDVYYERTLKILKEKGLDKTKVIMDMHSYSLPKGYKWAIFAGLEEVLKIFEGKPLKIWAMDEGTAIRPWEPVISIECSYGDVCVYESIVLGVVRFYSSIATKAARLKKIAGDRKIVFFGIRALHPAVTPAADRAAFIGGCDAVSGVIGAKLIKEKPVGTMPHELILIYENQVEAWKAFDDVMPPEVPRICLCDTWYDERIEAVMAAQALGRRLYGIRFDTPSSRRGDMLKIVKEARWTLDMLGYDYVKIVVSGGIDEEEIAELKDYVDFFGVGTAIACPPPVDFSFDLVAKYDEERKTWKPISKKGKLPGRKQVYRCANCFEDTIVPWGKEIGKCPKCGGEVKPLLKLYMDNGKIVRELPSAREIR